MKFIVVFCLLLVAANAFVLKPGRKSRIKPTHMHLQCKHHQQSNFWNIIFPGTKWCGDGDIADDYDDLGEFINTDKCCRTHDHCDDAIAAGEDKHGLVNEGLFTRSHCKCDLKFFNCLNSSECPVVSGAVAIAYFNVLGEQCFDLKPPATCVEYDEGLLGLNPRCVKYEYDDSQPEEWQWFDVPKWHFDDDELC